MQTKTDRATERPWETFTKGNYSGDGARNGWSIGICDKSRDETVCLIDCANKDTNYDTEKANAELIVRCVNSHDELVEACKSALGYAEGLSHGDLVRKLEEAIDKAEQ